MHKIVLKCFVICFLIVYMGNDSELAYAESTRKIHSNKGMKRFDTIMEASGVQSIADGRVLIIEDEQSDAITHVLTVVSEANILEGRLQSDRIAKFNDLEGVAIDSQGYLFAITSHSRSKKGKLKNSREQLVRFKVQGNRVTELQNFSGMGKSIKRKLSTGELNIEALSFDATGKKLLIGFREPLFQEKSLIVVLENPNAIFDKNEKPRFSEQILRFDLGGGGLRALDFFQKLNGYLLVNEVNNKKGKKRSMFWFWNGNILDAPRMVSIQGIKNLHNVEGITSVKIDGEPRILIVCDDGKIHKKKGSHFIVIHYEQLLIP
jgi:hypothetical protein